MKKNVIFPRKNHTTIAEFEYLCARKTSLLDKVMRFNKRNEDGKMQMERIGGLTAKRHLSDVAVYGNTIKENNIKI